MSELRIGDTVLTSESFWSKVKTFLHWHLTENVPAIIITHDNGNMTFAPDHSLFVKDSMQQRDASLCSAGEIRVGDWLITVGEDSFSSVLSVQTTTMEGCCAPLIFSGKLLVDGVQASCCAKGYEWDMMLPHWAFQLAMTSIASSRCGSFLCPMVDSLERFYPCYFGTILQTPFGMNGMTSTIVLHAHTQDGSFIHVCVCLLNLCNKTINNFS
mmetsp:Transcript_26870/g.40665  ORF Transcript_26870/g.40665 Transcript_26870/m.40665 type:complete len:213 (+) Transcript_26870:1318-1956(+)